MRVLLLVQDEQRIQLDSFYQAISDSVPMCKVSRLSSSEQANLKKYFKEHVKVSDFDRIILFLRFKKELKQVRFIQTIPNLVMLEHDACQNYLPGKYYGKFSKHYKSLPWARIICSGYSLADRLLAEGFDAVCVPKGYDRNIISYMPSERSIELGFIGSLKSQAYQERRAFLQDLADTEGLELLRTESGEEYNRVLNSIKFFVNADIGFEEYMAKNFEALAAGCLLCTYSQGEKENNALGFVDMENVILFKTKEELLEKIKRVKEDESLYAEITAAGRELAEARYSWQALGAKVVEELTPELREKKVERFWGISRYSLK